MYRKWDVIGVRIRRRLESIKMSAIYLEAVENTTCLKQKPFTRT